MTEDISRYEVQQWFDRGIIQSVESVPDESAEYHFGVKVADLAIDVVKQRKGGPILLVGGMQLADEHLGTFQDLSGTQKNSLLSQIGAVLTNSPGIYRFTDAEGKDVSFEEMRAIRVEHRIYPDAAGQHELMNGIISISRVLIYLRLTINTFLSNIESQR